MSENSPLTGIFFRDQALAMARTFSEINAGISVWGQNDERLLLHFRDHILNISKAIHARTLHAFEETLDANVRQYFSPAFTYTRKLLRGNIEGILKANISNLRKFESTFGKTDLIHAHCGYPGGYIAMLLKQRFGIPYMITEQMSPFPFSSFMSKKGNISDLIRLPYKHADQVIAVSPALADRIASLNLGTPKVIFNPVDETFFKPAEVLAENQNFRFFTLARLEHQKGIDVLLRSAREVIKIKSNAEFVIGGTGSESAVLKKLAVYLNIDKHIQWRGELTRQQALEQFQRCDAFVLPSRYESQGIVFTEAMACGKPSIGTRCGGPEFLINNDNGNVLEPDNVKDLTDALLKMMSEYKSYNGDLIRRDFMERFSFQAFAEQLMPLYQEILSNKNQAS